MARARLFSEKAQHAVGEPDDRLVRMRCEGVVVAEIAHRLRRGLAELGAPIADIDAPQPGAAIDQLPPVPVPQPDPGAPSDDRRAVLQVICDRCRRVDQALPIHFLERIILLSCRRHEFLTYVNTFLSPAHPAWPRGSCRSRCR